MHRLFCQSNFFKLTDSLCMIISTDIEPPSKLLPFENVKILPYKLQREKGFIDFRPNLFRDIKLIDRKLVQLYDERFSKANIDF